MPPSSHTVLIHPDFCISRFQSSRPTPISFLFLIQILGAHIAYSFFLFLSFRYEILSSQSKKSRMVVP